jgi:hypothetical protein
VTEKRGKQQRKILLESARSLVAYLDAAGIADDREGPLFRPFVPGGKSLIRASLRRETVWRIVKKYCREAGIRQNDSAVEESGSIADLLRAVAEVERVIQSFPPNVRASPDMVWFIQTLIRARDNLALIVRECPPFLDAG